MARPARTNAEWFMHPAAFRNDRRVKAIRARYGAAGYGLLTMLLELLTDADSTQLCLDEVEVELLAGDLGSTPDDVAGLVALAEKVGLFARTEAGCLRCPQLDEWLAPVFDKRNRARNAAEAAKLPQAAAETGVSVTETPQRRGEERRGENTKPSSLRSEGAADAAAPPEKKIGLTSVEPTPAADPGPGASHTEGGAADAGTSVAAAKPATKRFAPPTADEVLAYMLEQRPHNALADVERLATKCFGYYQANGWRVGKNPMKDWRAACQTFLADLPKHPLPAGLPPVQPATHFSHQRQPAASQLDQRQQAIAGADAMFDRLAAGENPYAHQA